MGCSWWHWIHQLPLQVLCWFKLAWLCISVHIWLQIVWRSVCENVLKKHSYAVRVCDIKQVTKKRWKKLESKTTAGEEEEARRYPILSHHHGLLKGTSVSKFRRERGREGERERETEWAQWDKKKDQSPNLGLDTLEGCASCRFEGMLCVV